MKKKNYEVPEAEKKNLTVDLNVQAQREITMYAGLSCLRKASILMGTRQGGNSGVSSSEGHCW